MANLALVLVVFIAHVFTYDASKTSNSWLIEANVRDYSIVMPSHIPRTVSNVRKIYRPTQSIEQIVSSHRRMLPIRMFADVL